MMLSFTTQSFKNTSMSYYTNYSEFRIGLESQFKERCVKLPSNKYELVVQERRRHLLRRGKFQYSRLFFSFFVSIKPNQLNE